MSDFFFIISLRRLCESNPSAKAYHEDAAHGSTFVKNDSLSLKELLCPRERYKGRSVCYSEKWKVVPFGCCDF